MRTGVLARYLIRVHIGPFLFSLSAITGLIVVNSVARRVDDLVGKGLPWEVIGEFLLYSLPHTVALSLPMSVLVAVLYAFSQLTSNSEITAMAAGGVHPLRVMFPVIGLGIIAASTMFYFNDVVLPESNHRLKNLLLDIGRKSPTLDLREQVVNELRVGTGVNRYFLTADQIDHETNELVNVTIFDANTPDRQRTTYADRGEMAFNNERTDLYLTLYDGFVHEVHGDRDGGFQRVYFEKQIVPLRDVGNELERRVGGTDRGDREMGFELLAQNARERELQHDSTVIENVEQSLMAVRFALNRPEEGDTQWPVSPRRSGAQLDGVTVLSQDAMTQQIVTGTRSRTNRAAALAQSANRFKVEIHKKLAIAFACFVFTLIGPPLALRFPRGGIGFVVTGSAFIFFLYWVGLLTGGGDVRPEGRRSGRDDVAGQRAHGPDGDRARQPDGTLRRHRARRGQLGRVGLRLLRAAQAPAGRPGATGGRGSLMRILDRLVAGTFLKLFFIIVLLAAPPLFVIGDIAENLASYIDRGLSGTEVAWAYVYQLPLFIQWSFPIAALLATVFTIHGMTIHREVVAAKAGGISFYRILAPLVLSAVGLTGIALGLNEVVPRTNKIAAQILRAETPGRSWRSDFVYQSEDGLTWQVARLTTADGRMSDVVLERPPSESSAGLHVTASEAAWTPEEGWVLASGFMRRLGADSTEWAVQFMRLQMPEISERPEELLEVPPEPEGDDLPGDRPAGPHHPEDRRQRERASGQAGAEAVAPGRDPGDHPLRRSPRHELEARRRSVRHRPLAGHGDHLSRVVRRGGGGRGGGRDQPADGGVGAECDLPGAGPGGVGAGEDLAGTRSAGVSRTSARPSDPGR